MTEGRVICCFIIWSLKYSAADVDAFQKKREELFKQVDSQDQQGNQGRSLNKGLGIPLGDRKAGLLPITDAPCAEEKLHTGYFLQIMGITGDLYRLL